MTPNRKGVTIKYAIATFGLAKDQGDLERMYSMFKVVLELWRKRNRTITILKTKIRELKKQLKIEVNNGKD